MTTCPFHWGEDISVVLSVGDSEHLFRVKLSDTVQEILRRAKELEPEKNVHLYSYRDTVPVNPDEKIEHYITACNVARFRAEYTPLPQITLLLPSQRQWQVSIETGLESELATKVAAWLGTSRDRVSFFYNGRRFHSPFGIGYKEGDPVIVVVDEVRQLLVFKMGDEIFEFYCGKEDKWMEELKNRIPRLSVTDFQLRLGDQKVTDPFGVGAIIDVVEKVDEPVPEAIEVISKRRVFLYPPENPTESHEFDINADTTFDDVKKWLKKVPALSKIRELWICPSHCWDSSWKSCRLEPGPHVKVLSLPVDAQCRNWDFSFKVGMGERCFANVTLQVEDREPITIRCGNNVRWRHLPALCGVEDGVCLLMDRILDDEVIDFRSWKQKQTVIKIGKIVNVLVESKSTNEKGYIKCLVNAGKVLKPKVYKHMIASQIARLEKCHISAVEILSIDVSKKDISYEIDRNAEASVDVLLPHLFLVSVKIGLDKTFQDLKMEVAKHLFGANANNALEFDLFVAGKRIDVNEIIGKHCYERESFFPVIVKMRDVLPLKHFSFSWCHEKGKGQKDGYFNRLWTVEQVKRFLCSEFDNKNPPPFPLTSVHIVTKPHGLHLGGPEFIWSSPTTTLELKFSRLPSWAVDGNKFRIFFKPLRVETTKERDDGQTHEDLMKEVLSAVPKNMKLSTPLNLWDLVSINTDKPDEMDVIYNAWVLSDHELLRSIPRPPGFDPTNGMFVLDNENSHDFSCCYGRVPMMCAKPYVVYLKSGHFQFCQKATLSMIGPLVGDRIRWTGYTLEQVKIQLFQKLGLSKDALQHIRLEYEGREVDYIEKKEGKELELVVRIKEEYKIEGNSRWYETSKTLADEIPLENGKCFCIQGLVCDGNILFGHVWDAISITQLSETRAVKVTWNGHEEERRFAKETTMDCVWYQIVRLFQASLSPKKLEELGCAPPLEWFELVYVDSNKRGHRVRLGGVRCSQCRSRICLGDMKCRCGAVVPIGRIYGPLSLPLFQFIEAVTGSQDPNLVIELRLLEIPARPKDKAWLPELVLDNERADRSVATLAVVSFDDGVIGFAKQNQEKMGPREPASRPVDFFREVALLSWIDHPCCVKLLGYLSEVNESQVLRYRLRTIVTEKMDWSLSKLLESKAHLTPTNRTIIAYGLARTYADFHRSMIRLRDIKPANVLLKKVGDLYYPIVCDMGLGKIVYIDDGTSILGTAGYRAGSVRIGSPFHERYDVGSFVKLMAELYDSSSGMFDAVKNWSMLQIAETLREGDKLDYPGTDRAIFEKYVRDLDKERRLCEERAQALEFIDSEQLDELTKGTGMLS